MRAVGKVTSKLQVTLPKAIADRLNIRPGDELAWSASGSTIHAVPVRQAAAQSVEDRLKSFDEATARQRVRNRRRKAGRRSAPRGWTREDLYSPPRGRTR
jgi:AbrB family looped-hinge helix DNA binding protein